MHYDDDVDDEGDDDADADDDDGYDDYIQGGRHAGGGAHINGKGKREAEGL